MLRFDIVDVFTDRPFSGNQLAVVRGAEGLADGQLLALAREFGFSETTFPSQVSGSAYTLRIFTPDEEIPFAGHPTLGTAWVLHRAGQLGESPVTQLCGVGPVEVTVGADLVSFRAAPRDLVPCPEALVEALLRDLGLSVSDLAGSAWLAGTGLSFVHVPVHAEAVARAHGSARPATSYPELAGLGTRDPVEGVNLYAGTADLHVRVFGLGGSVQEDAATGSAAAGLGMVLVASGALPSGGDYRIRQGAELGRPSRIFGSVLVDGGTVRSVSVAGQVQPVATGEIAVPEP